MYADPRQPIPLPRALIFLASIWMIASWLATIGFAPPIQASSSSYEPGVRLMLVCIGTGLLIAWPMLRLSQLPAMAPIRQTFLDLLVLIALVQVVIWPLRLVTRWSPERTAAIDALLLGWTLPVAAIVASVIGSRRRSGRTIGMVACLLLLAGGPLVNAMAAPGGTWAIIDLPAMLNQLTRGGGAPVPATAWWSAAVPAVAGIAAFAALGLRQQKSG